MLISFHYVPILCYGYDTRRRYFGSDIVLASYVYEKKNTNTKQVE